jgi:hypothetical protein
MTLSLLEAIISLSFQLASSCMPPFLLLMFIYSMHLSNRASLHIYQIGAIHYRATCRLLDTDTMPRGLAANYVNGNE